jgi:hypothetical protein
MMQRTQSGKGAFSIISIGFLCGIIPVRLNSAIVLQTFPKGEGGTATAVTDEVTSPTAYAVPPPQRGGFYRQSLPCEPDFPLASRVLMWYYVQRMGK